MRACRWIATVLLALLGLARGAGGVLALLGGPVARQSGALPGAATNLVGVDLLAVALLCLLSAFLVLRGAPNARVMAGVALVSFVAGGLLNGWLLYGTPQIGGVVSNVLYAALTAAALVACGPSDPGRDR